MTESRTLSPQRVREGRRARLVATAATLGIVIGILLGNARVWTSVLDEAGADYRFFVGVAEHWVATGSLYLDHQLAGPYAATTAVDVLYPPPALVLFLPFVWLPAVLWWAIPLSIIVCGVIRERPPYWSWPLFALLAWLPRDESIVIWGNTAMWIAAFVALGVQYRWPFTLVIIKPTFLPFAFLGADRRSWAVAVAVIAAIQIPIAGLWLDYMTALRNNIGSWPGPFYSVPDFAFVSIPLLAWVVGDRRSLRPRATGFASAQDRSGRLARVREVWSMAPRRLSEIGGRRGDERPS